MKSQTVIVLVLALICGGSAAIGVSQLVNAPAAQDGSTTKIVVAKLDVPRGHLLTEKVLELRDWPKSSLPNGVISSIKEASERTAIVPLIQGEPVLDGKLASKDAGRGLAAIIKPGMRAFTIETPHVAAGVGGFILPGNRVDILLTTDIHTPNDTTGGGATTTLLQNVEIVAVDQNMDKPDENQVDPKKLKSVTVLVTPNQAAKLDLGMNKGTLHLSLRNPEDNLEADTKPATMAELQFHQESPTKEGPSLLSTALTTITAILSARPDEKPAADREKELKLSDVIKEKHITPPQISQIRTLRGRHRGLVPAQR